MKSTFELADETQATAVRDVLKERKKQLEKWGIQNHEMTIWLAILHEETGELSEAVLHKIFGGPQRNYIFKEAVQVAAVALQIVEYLRQNMWDEAGEEITGEHDVVVDAIRKEALHDDA